MEYTSLSDTGLKVSKLALGTMNFGTRADFSSSREVFNACINAGINYFDTADIYGNGKSEEFLGKLIHEQNRNDFVIQTKGFFSAKNGINDSGMSRKHILEALNQSLKRLQTDYVDVYLIHDFDAFTSIEETIDTLNDLKKAGKILTLGVSNWAAWQIMESIGISKLNNWSQVKVLEPLYNLAKRQIEADILPMAAKHNLAVTPFSPLGGGLLTGKYGSNGRADKTGRLANDTINRARYSEDYQLASKFANFAQQENVNPISLAIAWVLHNKAITAPLIGARNLSQLQPALDALKINLSEDTYDKITSLSTPPVPANGRTEENVIGKWSQNYNPSFK